MPINPNVPASEYTAYLRARSDVVGRKFVPPDFTSSLLSSLVVNSRVGQSLGNKPAPPVSGYLTFGESASLYVPLPARASAFTIEFFAKITDPQTSQILFNTALSGEVLSVVIEDNHIVIYAQGLSFNCSIPSPLVGSWHHYAFCLGETGVLSIDGVFVMSFDLGTGTDDPYITIAGGMGGSFTGGMSNFRVTPSFLYPGSVPSIPLSASDSILLLLTYPEAAILDSSPLKNTVNKYGTVVANRDPISVAPPIFSEYGVLEFDDASIYSPETISLGTSNFTIEWYMRPTRDNIDVLSVFGNGSSFSVYIHENALYTYFGGPVVSTLVLFNEWHKYTIQRTSTTAIRVLIDNAEVGSLSFPGTYTLNGNPQLGYADYNSSYFYGSMTNFRISEGVQNDTLPLSGGRFLLLGDPFRPFVDKSGFDAEIENYGVTNSLGPITVVPYSHPGIFTGFSSSNFLQYPSFPLGTNFTVECFAKWSYGNSLAEIWSFIGETFKFEIGGLGLNCLFLRLNGTQYIAADDIPVDTWYHIALTRNNSMNYFSMNGVTTLIAGSSFSGSTGLLMIGGGFYNFPTGSISSFRVSDTPKYTSNFTVPSLPLEADTNTTLLLLGKPDNPFGDSSRYNRVASGTCTVVYEPIIL